LSVPHARHEFRAAMSLPDRYDPTAVESAAQTAWRAADAYRVTEDQTKPKFATTPSTTC